VEPKFLSFSYLPRKGRLMPDDRERYIDRAVACLFRANETANNETARLYQELAAAYTALAEVQTFGTPIPHREFPPTRH
jgi:hypothetical protein